MAWPKEYGGGGVDPKFQSIADQEMRRHRVPICFNVIGLGWAGPLINDMGTAEEKARYLKGILNAEDVWCQGFSEPEHGSDLGNAQTRAVRDGDEYVINGRKWFTSNAYNPLCKLFVVMGKTDPSAARHDQFSMILVPKDTPGVVLERPLRVLGNVHSPHGHAQVLYDNVRVPAENLLLGEGRGFEIAQGRLGPGRIHHCMRLIGMAERALEAMCDRANERVAFGRPLAAQGVVREAIADSRIEIDQARLLTLKAADMMDKAGNKVARSEIAMIKVVAPSMALRVIDRAVQIHGGAGVSDDFGLAAAWAGARTLRLADGPDEVHRNAIAKMELARRG